MFLFSIAIILLLGESFFLIKSIYGNENYDLNHIVNEPDKAIIFMKLSKV